MVGAVLIAAALVGAATVLFVSTASAAAPPYTLYGEYPAIRGVFDPQVTQMENQWTGKGAAIINDFVPQGGGNVANQMNNIWTNLHAIPLLSYPSCELPDQACDAALDQFISIVAGFLAGPDGTLSTSDDRRAYLRFGWEPNVTSSAWSPCASGNSFAGYIDRWRDAHDRFVAAGMNNTRLAWIYSVATGNSVTASCPAGTDVTKLSYPGAAYVDWQGVDAYQKCAGDFTTAADPMVTHLRTVVDPTKPMSIDEAGTSSDRTIASKNAFISDYWNYIGTHDIRMAVWFNVDNDTPPSSPCDSTTYNQPWAIFNTVHGDEVFAPIWHGFSAYRQGVQNPTVVSASGGGQRYVTDARFLGQ